MQFAFAIIIKAALITRRTRLPKAISLTSSGMWEQNYTRRDACRSTSEYPCVFVANYMPYAFFLNYKKT